MRQHNLLIGMRIFMDELKFPDASFPPTKKVMGDETKLSNDISISEFTVSINPSSCTMKAQMDGPKLHNLLLAQCPKSGKIFKVKSKHVCTCLLRNPPCQAQKNHLHIIPAHSMLFESETKGALNIWKLPKQAAEEHSHWVHMHHKPFTLFNSHQTVTTIMQCRANEGLQIWSFVSLLFDNCKILRD